MFKRLLALLILHTVLLIADTSYWDGDLVRAYVHNSEMQRRWAFSFAATHLKQLRGDETVLDIGCGDGKITADISKFVPQGSVIGIDPSHTMLEWARKQYHPTEYPNVSFQEGNFLEPPSATFDLIVSFCALQHCFDQEKAFANLAKLLKKDGKLLILVPASTNPLLNKARKTVQNRPKWAAYWEKFVPRKFLTPSHYVELLKSAQLEPVRVEMVKTMDPFINRSEILDWFQGTFAPVMPAELAREFYNEWLDEYLLLYPEGIRSDGVIYAELNVIQIEAVHMNK